MARMADIGKAHMAFYPCGGEEWEEDPLRSLLAKGKPRSCRMQCTSHTERLQLALLDQPHGMGTAYLNAEEKSFLNALNQDEKCRMFALTDEERAFLDEAKEGGVITMPPMPSLPSSAGTQMCPYPLAEPVEHPVEVADILKDTVSRYFECPASLLQWLQSSVGFRN